MFNSFSAGQNNFRCFQQILCAEIGLLFQRFRITAINENRATPGGMTAVNVPPAVTDHPALREVNAQGLRRPQQHARPGFAAVAVGRALARVITDLHPVNRKPLAHFGVNRLDNYFFERPAAHVRLVGCDNEQEAGLLQLCTGSGNLGENFKFVQVPGRIRFAVTLQRMVNDAIAIKKNGTS